MKKVLFLLLVNLVTLRSYSQDTKLLIENTLNGKLKETQFCENGYYFITVDTVLQKDYIENGQLITTFNYSEYGKKSDVTYNLNEIMKHFGFNDYYNLKEFKNIETKLFGLSKIHIRALSDKDGYTYMVSWWFSEENDYTKLKGVTISKISKKES
jgi:hypothetical protein